MARSPDDDSRISRKSGSDEIPDVPGAPKGLLGIKTPFGRSQYFDIMDRAQAAGILGMKPPALKFDR